MSGYDLHTHSTYSDGATSIEANIREAAQLGLEGIGVTDHDTTGPFEVARAAADEAGIDAVLGTEFSAEEDGRSVHVLGYWIDPGFAPLAAELDRLRDERTDRARRIVTRFNDLGIQITFERVRELAGGAPIGRPHLAAAVVETGAATSTREVFDRYLADGGPAYVSKHAVSPERAVELLVAACGVPVLAHPGLFGDRTGDEGIPDELVERMVASGLAGIEADHPDHSDEHRRRYRDLARAHALEVTAGSDHHGKGEEDRLGRATTSRGTVERLRTWRVA
ncbi:MAG: PHP domain-containing protein [Nitriliruptoraceae bacterium]